MATVIRIASIVMILAVGSVAVFISQLYSPGAFWIISYLLLFGSIFVGMWVAKRSYRLLASLIFSLVINANYLSYVPYANPVATMVAYGLGLLLVVFVTIFLTTEIVAGMVRERHSKAE